MRDRLARLKRKSKAYSKDIGMLRISINLWVNKDIIFSDIDKYCGYNRNYGNVVWIKSVREKREEVA
jgi:hypothetical protein